MTPETLVVGVGNEQRGDDAVGLEVVRRLGDLGSTVMVTCTDEPIALLSLWEGVDRVVLVDAVSSGNRPGTVYRHVIEPGDAIPSVRDVSTHAFGLESTLSLARAMGVLPPRVVVLGVEGATFEYGSPLSSACEQAVGRMVDMVREAVRCTSIV